MPNNMAPSTSGSGLGFRAPFSNLNTPDEVRRLLGTPHRSSVSPALSNDSLLVADRDALFAKSKTHCHAGSSHTVPRGSTALDSTTSQEQLPSKTLRGAESDTSPLAKSSPIRQNLSQPSIITTTRGSLSNMTTPGSPFSEIHETLAPLSKADQTAAFDDILNPQVHEKNQEQGLSGLTAGTTRNVDAFSDFQAQYFSGDRNGFGPENATSIQPHSTSTVVRARHDRDTLYTIRKRTDGSISLLKASPLSYMKSDQNTSPLSTHLKASSSLEEGAHHDFKYKNYPKLHGLLTDTILQMMFVSGEQAEPSTDTTWMIEEIVREQVVEMLKEATALANRRGSKSISIVDLIFQIRHNPAKVSRLKTFLSWKDVRKNVKDSDDKAGGADADALDLEEGTLPGANPAAPQKSSTNKKAKLTLPWEVQSFYSEIVPEREDEEDEEEEEQNEATLARLASADERTKNMTKDEYVYWSDCRQASFTFRKGKRFREWAGFGTVIDSKPNDDVVDILGFLTFEIVQTLTEEALKVKAAEDLANKKASGLRGDNENNKKRKREGCTLFEMPEEGRTPVEPKHVREAFRRLQIVPTKYKFMRQGYAGVRTPLRMI